MPSIRVVGVVSNRPVAEQVVGNLRLAGFSQNDVSFIIVRPEAAAQLEKRTTDQTGKGTRRVLKGVARGALIGLVIGLLAGLALYLIPFFNEVLGVGIFMGLFGGAGLIVGALAGAFSTETPSSQVVERYGMELRAGQALITVEAPDEEIAKTAEEILHAGGAVKVNSFLADSERFSERIEAKPAVVEVSPKEAKQQLKRKPQTGR